MAATEPREALTALAFAFFAKHGNQSTIEKFSDLVHRYWNIDTKKVDKSELSDYLPFLDVDVDRITDLKNTTKEWKIFKGYAFEKGHPVKFDHEIFSAFASAEEFFKSPYGVGMSTYIICDQGSEISKELKDRALKKVADLLGIPPAAGGDILSSADLFLVKSSKIQAIISEIKKNITEVDDMQILDNMAHGTTGKNTVRTIVNKYFSKKELLPVSLKQIPANASKAKLKIVGTVNVPPNLRVHLDPYTEFLAKVETLKTKTELKKLIDKMVEIEDLVLGDNNHTLNVKWKFKYKDVEISDKIVEGNFQVGRSGFNGAEKGLGGFIGGASYATSLPALKKYPGYPTIEREITKLREKAFDYVFEEKNIPKHLKSLYTKAKAKIRTTNILILMGANLNIIEDFCRQYDSYMKSEDLEYKKNSYQEFRIAVVKLCKNRKVDEGGDFKLRRLNYLSTKTSGTGAGDSLHNQFVHSQGIWLFTRNNAKLKDYFKKQISLTLYGIMSKKGGKVFNNPSRDKLIESAFTKEFRRNSKPKLAQFITAPFILIQ